MWIKETVKPLLEDCTGPHRRLVAGYLLLAVLFLLYIYAGKNVFLKGDGYGIPAAVSGKTANLNRKIYGLQRSLGTNLSEDRRQQVTRELRELRGRAAGMQRSSGRTRDLMRYIGWFGSGFFFLFLVPVVVIRVTPGMHLREYGLGIGDWRFSLRVFLLFVGVMLAAVLVLLLFRVQGFLRFYPMYAKGAAGLTPGWFLLLEFFYLLYFVGWEFYFRALLLFPLEKHLGSLTPLVGVLPFAIMHVGKPVPEVFGSILAAWFLGVVVLKSRSFWVCPAVHFLIAFSMDLAAVLQRGLV